MPLKSRTKHQIFNLRFGGYWCATCATCPEVLLATRWSGALGLLTLHVREHRPLTTVDS